MTLSPQIQVLLVGLLVTLVVYYLLNRRGPSVGGDILRRLTGRGEDDESTEQRIQELISARRRSGLESVANVLAKPLEGSEYERNKLSLKLAQAGYRQERAVAIFLAAKIIGALGGLLIGWVLFGRGPSEPGAAWYDRLLAPLGGLCVGFFLPQFWLNLAASGRAQNIIRGLPDSLDMLVVMMEAGLGLDAAIQRCSDEITPSYPEIADEWRLASRETQMGLTRGEAMRKMALRTGVPEMQSLVAIINQAERFGTSIATALRIHSDTLRTKRRQKAEEAAAKTAVKLIFPLILCIFPTIFIVLAGPAAMKIGAALK